jgi:2-oxoglutarate dehydrogenase complex dehydrogenase (E1) component-like enzyme
MTDAEIVREKVQAALDAYDAEAAVARETYEAVRKKIADKLRAAEYKAHGWSVPHQTEGGRMNAKYFSLTDEELQVLLREAAKDAITVQDACNLSGVVYSWARHMNVICELSHRENQGTDWRNHHPINKLFASKVAALTGVDDVMGANPGPEAWDACKALAQ